METVNKKQLLNQIQTLFGRHGRMRKVINFSDKSDVYKIQIVYECFVIIYKESSSSPMYVFRLLHETISADEIYNILCRYSYDKLIKSSDVIYIQKNNKKHHE